jgi:hypothetical protein
MPRRGKQYGPRTPRQEQESRGFDFLGSAFRTEDLLIINLPPNVRQRTRISKKGKIQRRLTLEIETEPVFHDLNEERLGREAAEELAAQIAEQIRESGKKVSEATKKWREWAKRRIESGNAKGQAGTLLRMRYSGGRTGHTPPLPPHDKYGYDSGRLAENVFARLNRGARAGDTRSMWIINVPANRLTTKGWQGTKESFDTWIRQFREMLNLSAIMVSPGMESKLRQGLARAIGKLEAENWRKKRQLLRTYGRIVGGLRVLAVV